MPTGLMRVYSLPACQKGNSLVSVTSLLLSQSLVFLSFSGSISRRIWGGGGAGFIPDV